MMMSIEISHSGSCGSLSMVGQRAGFGFGSVIRSRPSSWAFASLCLPGSQWQARDASRGFSTVQGKVPGGRAEGGSRDQDEKPAVQMGGASLPGDFSQEDTKWKEKESLSLWKTPGLYLELSKAKLSALVTLTAMVSSFLLFLPPQSLG